MRTFAVLIQSHPLSHPKRSDDEEEGNDEGLDLRRWDRRTNDCPALHEVGIEAEVFEQASEVRELGVGINLQPHSVHELVALGLLPALDRVGLRMRRLIYMTGAARRSE